MFDAKMNALLMRINMGGLINDCVLDVKKGSGSICAVDESNSILAICSAKIGEKKSEDSSLGFSSLSVLCKYLNDSDKEIKYVIDDEDWVTLNRGGKFGKLKMLLADPAEVPNTVENGMANRDGLLAESSVTFTLKPDGWEKLGYYLSLLSATSAGSIFFSSKKGKITAFSNPHEHNQFNVIVGKADTKTDATVEITSKYLEAALKVVDWELPVTIHFGDNTPVIVHQKGKTFESFWAITPYLL